MTDQEKDRNLRKSTDYSLSEAIDALGFGLFQIALAFGLGVVYLADAMEIMVLPVLGPLLECTWDISKTNVAFLTTCMMIGMAIGAPLWGYVSDVFGRKRILVASGVLLLAFGTASVFAPTFDWFLILRLLCGFCISSFPQCDVLLAEYMPSYARGRAVTFMSFVFACGGTLVILSSWATISAPEDWRKLLFICVSPVIIFLGICYWLPESLLYMSNHGQNEKAEDSLKLVASINRKKNLLQDMKISTVLSDCQIPNSSESCYGKIYNDIYLILQPNRLLVTLVIWSMWFLNGVSIYGIMLSSPEILKWVDKCDENVNNQTQGHLIHEVMGILNTTEENEGQINITINGSSNSGKDTSDVDLEQCKLFSSEDYKGIIWASLGEVPGMLISVCILDIVGRKATYLVSTGIFTISLLPLCINPCAIPKTWVVILLFCSRGSAVMWNTTNFVYTPESYPTKIRSSALGVGSGIMRVGVMITPFIAQVLMPVLVSLGTFTYVAVGAIAFILSLLLPSETMRVDLSKVGETISSEEPISIQCVPLYHSSTQTKEYQENQRLLKEN